MASIYCTKATASRDAKQVSFGCVLFQIFYGTLRSITCVMCIISHVMILLVRNDSDNAQLEELSLWCLLRRDGGYHYSVTLHPNYFLWEYTCYNDVIMGATAHRITSLTIAYSSVDSGSDQRNIKAPPHWLSLAFVREITGDRWIPRTKGQ